MKYKILGLSIALSSIFYLSCSKDTAIDTSKSVIIDSPKENTKFDLWLTENFLDPYNICVQYKYVDNQTNQQYYLSPALPDKAQQLAQLVKYMCIEPYDETTNGQDFIRNSFPKQIDFMGSAGVNANGTEILGVAEGGMKIVLYKVNKLDVKNIKNLNFYYFHTIHHEYTHIQNQLKPYPTEFKEVTPSSYTGDTWNTSFKDDQQIVSKVNTKYLNYRKEAKAKYDQEKTKLEDLKKKNEDKTEIEKQENIVNTELDNFNYFDNVYNLVYSTLLSMTEQDIKALTLGFISPYASKDYNEDFAEIQAFFITDDQSSWLGKLYVAGLSGENEGGSLILKKLDIIKKYLKSSWNLDIDALRTSVQNRTKVLEEGKFNFKDLK